MSVNNIQSNQFPHILLLPSKKEEVKALKGKLFSEKLVPEDVTQYICQFMWPREVCKMAPLNRNGRKVAAKIFKDNIIPDLFKYDKDGESWARAYDIGK